MVLICPYYSYDDFGAVTNETVVGVAGTNTIIRHWDSVGRSTGYSLVGRAVPGAPQRQSTLAYVPATGRLAMMLAAGSDMPFMWNYLPGSDIKSSLAYPNGLTASWQYDANNQLLQVRNAFPTNTISQYDYVYDVARRRISVSKSGTAFDQGDTISYAYNEKNELTNAVAAVDSNYRYAYGFDDIGNRETSSERGTNVVYAANQLNQYTAVDDFTLQFDEDGNQTLVKTATGIWQVQYNGENRPIFWVQGTNTISMSYDRMGRRVIKNDQRFVYDEYLQIANFEAKTLNSKLQTFIWDPTEPVATRPLAWNRDTSSAYYTHDGNKNVSEVIVGECDVSAHYVYTPFGVVSSQYGASAASNPWRFSSEIAEDDTATVYYNYRHYEPVMGRWLSRDPIEDIAGQHSYIFESNRLIDMIDPLGLWALNLNYSWGPTSKSFLLGPWLEGDISVSGSVTLSGERKDGVWKGKIEGLSQAEVGILFGKSFAFGFGWRKSWNVMGRAGLRFFAGVGGGVKGLFEYDTCSGRGSANMVFPAKIYGGVEGIAKLTVYKYYKWANQHGSGYKMPNVYEIGMFVSGVISGDLRGTIKCDEKVCVISTTMVSEGTLSGGAKFFGWSVSLSRTKKFGEIKIFEDVVESPLRKLSRILR